MKRYKLYILMIIFFLSLALGRFWEANNKVYSVYVNLNNTPSNIGHHPGIHFKVLNSNEITNLTDNGWAWRLPSLIKMENQTYLKESYNGTSWIWNSVYGNVTAIGSKIDIVPDIQENVFHVFISNMTILQTYNVTYSVIQHWLINFTNPQNIGETVIPEQKLIAEIAVYPLTQNTTKLFGFDAVRVWSGKIFLFYGLIESGANKEAHVYYREWNGTTWIEPIEVWNSGLEFTKIQTAKDLIAEYYSNSNNTIVSLLIIEPGTLYDKGDLCTMVLYNNETLWRYDAVGLELENVGVPDTKVCDIMQDLSSTNNFYITFTLHPHLAIQGGPQVTYATYTPQGGLSWLKKPMFNLTDTGLEDGFFGSVSTHVYLNDTVLTFFVAVEVVLDEERYIYVGTYVPTTEEKRLKFFRGNLAGQPKVLTVSEANISEILWMDSSLGVREVMHGFINISSLTELLAERATNKQSITLHYSATKEDNSIFIAHISYGSLGGTTRKLGYISPGFYDSDKDYLGDFEEANYYSSYNLNITNADTDDDNIVDGSEIFLYNTNPSLNDTDGDFLTDYEELVPGSDGYKTDPLSNDTDSDGVLDGYEYGNSTNPLKSDTDEDGLTDYQELSSAFKSLYPTINPNDSDSDDDSLSDGAEYFTYHTNISNPDTDGDGLEDGSEVLSIGTDPLKEDTDGDLLNDSFEYANSLLDPLDPDGDGDGLLDGEEILTYHTNVSKYDTDGDGLSDYEEVKDPAVTKYGANPLSNDTDNDGINDYKEVKVFNTMANMTDTDSDGIDDYAEIMEYGTSPLTNDTDSDGILDWDELFNSTIRNFGVDPLNNDTDSDGLSDYDEVFVYNTLANTTDTDGDGLLDATEISKDLDPLNNDTDSDGLSDYEELYITKTSPKSNDTDSDELTDYDEIKIYYTNPKSNDTDSDGVLDYQELINYGTNPLTNDTDTDGLDDYFEIHELGTDPRKPDSDDDGLSDGREVLQGTDPNDSDTDNDGLTDFEEINGVNITGLGIRSTDPLENDTDSDGLLDKEEVEIYHTDPTRMDTDEDLLSDYYEVNYSDTSPVKADTDGDGLSDYEEIRIYGSNPAKADTDSDGVGDYIEVKVRNSNPNSVDTDGDFIPDNIDILFPTFPDELLVIIAFMAASLLYAKTYGMFRDWKDDVVAIGLSDLGGTLMTIYPKAFADRYDPALITPAMTGMHQLISEISGKKDVVVLSGALPTILSVGKKSFMWVMVKKAYPRIKKKIIQLHKEIEKKYETEISRFSGLEEEVAPIYEFMAHKIAGEKVKKVKKKKSKKAKKKRPKKKPKKEETEKLVKELKELEPKEEELEELEKEVRKEEIEKEKETKEEGGLDLDLP
ncbi:MAG: hypothetical protein Q6351_003960 [Candidatus Njordarchaeum guaymaensis]